MARYSYSQKGYVNEHSSDVGECVFFVFFLLINVFKPLGEFLSVLNERKNEVTENN